MAREAEGEVMAEQEPKFIYPHRVCPHGVDQEFKVDSETTDAGVCYKVWQRQCLRCAHEAGIIVLYP